VLACLLVFCVNGGPLSYFDTADYLNRGGQMLAKVGISPPPPIAAIHRNDAPDTDDAPRPGSPPVAPAKTADVSRSLVYAVLLGMFAAPHALEGVVLVNALVATFALWLPLHVVLRERFGEPGRRLDAGMLTFAAVAGGVLGSLSFYAAFLMPDIFTPALLLIAATLTGFAARMRRSELAACVLLGAVAVMVHTSHLAIAALLVPVVLVGSLLLGGPRRWLAPMLFAAIALIGFAQQEAVRYAVGRVEKSETVYLPFLTARLVQDGPGRAYLNAHCPNAAIPTCALHAALSRSNDPWRLTATHIIFERSQRLGSFRLMSAGDQRDVAAGQIRFFFAVLADRPLETTGAVLRNMMRQATMNSVDMTVPEELVRERMAGVQGLAFTRFDGRLRRTDAWLGPVAHMQDALYLLSLAAVVTACCWPGLPGRLRAFLLMILAGIAINALVCGGISQPATRYGARVIWLLPAVVAAAAGLLLASRPRPSRQLAPKAREERA
jgi:hypothetical protein